MSPAVRLRSDQNQTSDYIFLFVAFVFKLPRALSDKADVNKKRMIMNNKVPIPQVLPLLPLRDAVVFPYMLLSLYVGREASKKAVAAALNNNRIIFVSTQKNPETADANEQSVFKIGTASIILRMRKLKDGRMKVLIQGLSRAYIASGSAAAGCRQVRIKQVRIKEAPDLETQSFSVAARRLTEHIKDTLKTLTALGGSSSPDLLMILDEVTHPGKLADLIAGHFELKVHEMQSLLEIFDPEERLKKLHHILNKELEILKMQSRIKKIIKNNLSRFPNDPVFSPMPSPHLSPPHSDVRTEEMQELAKKVLKAGMPEPAQKEIMKHISRLERMHPESSEASMMRSYLDWVVELPWGQSTKDNLDLTRAEDILERDHFSLNEVKERILEFLAVRRLKKDAAVKAPILCFIGPPGVGKTSLGKSIAEAMQRKYARIALGGVKDEAEIRGHRRTYVGAMPGKILQALKQVQSNNPVLVLDEVDKLGADFRGDPSSALLEVLDPEQNLHFKDHYLNLNFDLSRIMFIATANTLDTIPLALRDRMEVIFISGYTPGEKLQIAKKHIIHRQLESHGVDKTQICFSDKGIHHLIFHYTKEAGLRNLSRELGSLCRKMAKKVVLGQMDPEAPPMLMTPKKITELLGPARFLREDSLKTSKVGVSTGLAWTPAGGEVLYVEALRLSGQSGRGGIILTGRLGKVMEESAKAAYSYVRMYVEKMGGISSQWFKKNEIHIHLPSGAVPKDGPSAGAALAVALVSLMTGAPARKDTAMTGEIGLQGQVLPVGGVKEKALAALNQGIRNVILPLKNKPDIENPTSKDCTLKELRAKMRFLYVENLDEVFALALETGPSLRSAVSMAS